MKTFIYTGKVDTWHPGIGILKPGRNSGPDGEVDAILEAGKASGDYLPDKHPPKPGEGVATGQEAILAEPSKKSRG